MRTPDRAAGLCSFTEATAGKDSSDSVARTRLEAADTPVIRPVHPQCADTVAVAHASHPGMVANYPVDAEHIGRRHASLASGYQHQGSLF